MNNTPLTRTNPTVKQSPASNKRTLHWEMRLGLVPLVMLLGVILGSVACAFLLGYHSGQRVGFDNALASTQASMARLPIGAPKRERKRGTVQDEGADVYQELETRAGKGLAKDLIEQVAGKGEKDGAAMPELGVIKDVKDAPVAPNFETQLKPELEQAKTDLSVKSDLDALLDVEEKEDLGKAAAKSGAVIRVLGGAEHKEKSGSDNQGPTLGGLLAKNMPAVEPPSQVIEKSVQAAALEGGTAEAHPVEIAKASLAPAAIGETNAKSVKSKKVESPAKEEKSLVSAAGSLAKPEQKEKEAAPINKTMPAKSIRKGWFAQVAAPRKRADADDVAAKLRSSGFGVTIETARVSGEEYYRVLVGPEDNREQAERLVSQLGRERYLSGVPFIRLLK